MPADLLVSRIVIDVHNRLAVRPSPTGLLPAEAADFPDARESDLALPLPSPVPDQPAGRLIVCTLPDRLGEGPAANSSPPGVAFLSLGDLVSADRLGPDLATILATLEPHLAELPYAHLGPNDFIYKFRPAHERNAAIYDQDPASRALYQSTLCAAIKALARRHERSAAEPVPLDFGPVRYHLPSHFGFCLGVKNAIERAYETLAENPGRRVFMLSELIHNPFVNEDLLRRGLRYLQSDKGIPFAVSGRKITPEAPATADDPARWDTLAAEDIVIIPAFGATDEDKRRLVRRGLAVFAHDATCMLVEKVWKAARTYGQDGHTVIIHGKHEHEETKATFSHTRRHAHAVIVRDLAEARRLSALLARRHDPAAQLEFERDFAGRHTPGFAVARHLDRIAVVNQTTLLVNETRAIIDHLRVAYAAVFGPDTPATPARVGGGGRADTLCYATQVNQDALARALARPLDAAFVIGGKNSSNTFQLHRLCEERLGPLAFFIQCEADILSLDAVRHYIFPAHGPGAGGGRHENRPLWPGETFDRPREILITGGASCPDGLIQQVVARLNTFFPADRLRPVEAVLADLERPAAPAPSP